MLKRDFDLELNIASGSGKSRDDPIIVLDFNSLEASRTVMKLLMGLGMGRGILWRVLARNLFKHNKFSIEQIEIETKDITDTEIITTRENYYFDVSKVITYQDHLPDVIAFSDEGVKLDFPFELGWLHFKGITDHESLVSGLGKGIAYGALGIKATVYVYDNTRSDISDDIDSSIDVQKEFKRAVFDFIEANPTAGSSGELSIYKGFLIQAFSIGENFSIIGLSVFSGKFIKLRITHVQDALLVDVSNQFIASVDATLAASNIVH